MTAATPRRLLPPPAGPADSVYRRRQARLQQAHDDWALHADADDPRAAIHQALGLVRFHRRAVRELIHRIRREPAGESGPLARRNRLKTLRRDMDDALAAYRAAVADAAEAIALFDLAAEGRDTAAPYSGTSAA